MCRSAQVAAGQSFPGTGAAARRCENALGAAVSTTAYQIIIPTMAKSLPDLMDFTSCRIDEPPRRSVRPLSRFFAGSRLEKSFSRPQRLANITHTVLDSSIAALRRGLA